MLKRRLFNPTACNIDLIFMWLTVALFFMWQISHTGGLRWEYDEGAYLAGAHFISQGYTLYSEVFAVQPPLFFYSLLWGFWFPDMVVPLGRVTMIGFGTVGLAATGLLGRRIGGPWTGFLTVLLLAWHPRFLVYSKVIIGDVPSMSLTMVALWLLWRYTESVALLPQSTRPTESGSLLPKNGDIADEVKRGTSGYNWLNLLLSSLVLGLAFGIKLLPIFLLPLFALIIAHHHYRQIKQPKISMIIQELQKISESRRFSLPRPFSTCSACVSSVIVWLLAQPQLLVSKQGAYIVKDGLVFGTGLLSTLLILLLPFDVNAFIEQNLRFRLSGMIVTYTDIPNWLYILADLLTLYIGYSLLALAGVVVLWQKNRWHSIFGAAWVVITFVALANYDPLWPHLLVVWAFPQAILAAIALKALVHHLQTVFLRRPKFNALNGFLTISTILFFISLPYQAALNDRYRYAPTKATDAEVIAYLNDHVSDERFIITDEPLLAVVTDKKLLPILSDTSNVRLQSGLLTDSQMIELTKQYQPQVIIFGWEQRFVTHLPHYLEWVKANYKTYSLKYSGNLLFIEK